MIGFEAFEGKQQESFQCPNCRALAWHEQIIAQEHSLPAIVEDQNKYEHQLIRRVQSFLYRCSAGCKRVTFISAFVGWSGPLALLGQFDKDRMEIEHVYPFQLVGIDPSIPKQVVLAAIEAQKCLSATAYSACGTMARKSIDRLTRNLGAKGGDLKARLKFLRDNHQITESLWEWADGLRVVGNDGAHGAKGDGDGDNLVLEDVTEDDANHAVLFLGEILNYVYVVPARQAATRKTRQ